MGGAGVVAQLEFVLFELLTVTLGPLSHWGNVGKGTISCCTLVLPFKHPGPIVLRIVRPSKDTDVRFVQFERKPLPMLVTFERPCALKDASEVQLERKAVPMLVTLESPCVSMNVSDVQEPRNP